MKKETKTVADEFFSLAPKYRTKKMLNELVEAAIQRAFQQELEDQEWEAKKAGYKTQTQALAEAEES